MYKNLAIIALALLVLAEGGYILKLRHARSLSMAQIPVVSDDKPRPTVGSRPPAPPAKGDKLADSAIAKFAYPVYPDALTDAAKTALIGWDVKVMKNKDGSAVVSMVPHNPEDPTSSYTVKSGEKLYFVEMTAADDKVETSEDNNLRDDYGVIVDGSGIIQ
jgi:hypothetical protein